MFQIKVGEKNENNVMFNHFVFGNLAIVQIIWKNMAEPDRPQVTI
jgi:hypothetical protein